MMSRAHDHAWRSRRPGALGALGALVLLLAAAIGRGMVPVGARSADRPASPLSGTYVLADTWRSSEADLAPDVWREASGVAIGPDEAIYVADAAGRRLSVIAPDGTVALLGADGGRGDVAAPTHLAVDAARHRLYVADPPADAVRVFDLDGTPIGAWTPISAPTGIAAASDESVLVASGESGRVIRFDAQGRELGSWPAVSPDGRGDALRGLDVAADGTVYVVSGRNDAVLAFDPSGRALETLHPPGDLEVRDVAALTMAGTPARNRLWLATSGGLVSYDSRLDTWTTNPVGSLSAVAIDAALGAVVTVPGAPGVGSRVLQLVLSSGPGTPPERTWGSALLVAGILSGPESIAVGLDGHAYVLDRGMRIQRFALDGTAIDQVSHDSPFRVGAAADGSLYVTDGGSVQGLSPTGTERWRQSVAAAGSEGNAVALAVDRTSGDVLVIDAMADQLRRFGAGGDRGATERLPAAADGSSLWSGVASPGDGAVYALDRGRDIVAVRSPSGEWRTIALPDPARQLAVGPDGALFTLDRDGWVRRYDQTGTRTAAFDAARFDVASGSEPSSVAVDDAGSIYVTDRAADVVSRFAWSDQAIAQPPPSPDAPRCQAVPDKLASPSEVALGDEVEVRLVVRGGCGPGVATDPVDLVLILDRSGSMQGDRMRVLGEAALGFVAELHADRDRAAIVSFSDSARRDVVLTSDLGAVRNAIRALVPDGQTAIDAALALASDELARRGRPGVRHVFILFSDGGSAFDPALREADAAKAADTEIYTIGILAWASLMRAIASNADHYYEADNPRFLYGIFERIAERVTTATLFGQITIADHLPANMRYLAGSTLPPGSFDGTTLAWTLQDVGFAGFSLRFRLVPEDAGTWPTNEMAFADYTDGFGATGHLDFPVPFVRVVGSAPTATASPTASPSRTATPAPSGTPSPSPAATVRPRPIYLPVALREACEPGKRHADVVLVFDTSSSMTGEKLAAAEDAARTFLALLDLPLDHVAVTSFDESARLVCPLTGSADLLLSAILGMKPSPGTRIDLGLEEAVRELEGTRRDPSHSAVIVLLTDGRQEDAGRAIAAALRARAGSVRIFAIGLGEDVDAAVLEAIAGSRSRTFLAPGATELAGIYAAIAESVPCPPEDFWGRRD